MFEIFTSVIKDLVLYNGKSILIPLFILALVFLWGTEKDKSVRNIFVYLSTALIAIFLCPVFALIGNKFDNEIYYRVWWCVPIGVTVCYVMVKLVFRFNEFWKRILAFVLVVMIVVINGKFIYTNSYRFNVENRLHLPQMVVDVADFVTLEYDTPVTIMAPELMMYVRQYNSNIQVPFSRFYFNDANLQDLELYEALNASEYDVEFIANRAKDYKALYVVLNGSIPQNGDMKEQGFTYLVWIDGYYIYRYEQLYQDYIQYGAITGES